LVVVIGPLDHLAALRKARDEDGGFELWGREGGR